MPPVATPANFKFLTPPKFKQHHIQCGEGWIPDRTWKRTEADGRVIQWNDEGGLTNCHPIEQPTGEYDEDGDPILDVVWHLDGTTQVVTPKFVWGPLTFAGPIEWEPVEYSCTTRPPYPTDHPSGYKFEHTEDGFLYRGVFVVSIIPTLTGFTGVCHFDMRQPHA